MGRRGKKEKRSKGKARRGKREERRKKREERREKRVERREKSQESGFPERRETRSKGFLFSPLSYPLSSPRRWVGLGQHSPSRATKICPNHGEVYGCARECFFEISNKCYQHMSFGMQTLTPNFKTIYPITRYHMCQSTSKAHPNQCQKHTPTITKARPDQHQSTPWDHQSTPWAGSSQGVLWSSQGVLWRCLGCALLMVGVCSGSDWRRDPNIVMFGSGATFLYHFWMISGPPNV